MGTTTFDVGPVLNESAAVDSRETICKLQFPSTKSSVFAADRLIIILGVLTLWKGSLQRETHGNKMDRKAFSVQINVAE